MTRAILTLNGGSSSIKFALFKLSAHGVLAPLLTGAIENTTGTPHFSAVGKTGSRLADEIWPDMAFSDLLHKMLSWIEDHLGAARLIGIGHRVVHGGPDHYRPERVTETLLGVLERLVELAPLHVPHNLEPIRELARSRPDLPQVACFDTAFHHAMPEVACRFGLPRRFADAGIRRYGFHGLSYEYIAGQLAELAPALSGGRVIAAHLGNGASLCAMKAGVSIDTTMGFTALDGLLMGTRCGAIDPGAVLHIMKHDGMDAFQMEAMLYKQSGLLGVSGGLSNDMRTLLASDKPEAREAVELFCYRIARETGALVSSLGGLDGFVFTGGIGEHAAEVRADVVRRLSWLGAVLDEDANARHRPVISAPESKVEVRVIAANEEVMIARHTLEAVG
jgi:acetate kinase